MSRRIFLLMGISIIAVVINHAVGWGNTALFWWTDRYRAVSVPNYDQMGGITYYVLLVLKQTMIFGVPAFLFAAGYFSAFAARANSARLTWKPIRPRVMNLLPPYAVWSALVFATEPILLGTWHRPLEYLALFLTDGASPTYFYVPLLCYTLLLAPLLVAGARANWRLLLAGSAIVQLALVLLRYLPLAGVQGPALDLALNLTPDWLPFRWLFFFAFGVVYGFHTPQIKPWLVRYRYYLLAALILLAGAHLYQADVAFRTTLTDAHTAVDTLSFHLFGAAFIACFLAFDRLELPFSKAIYRLSPFTLGIYLLHPRLLEVLARLIRKLGPWALQYQIILLPMLIVAGIGIPVLIMEAFSRSPLRRYYRYLFG